MKIKGVDIVVALESVKSSRRYIRYIERLLHFIFRNFY